MTVRSENTGQAISGKVDVDENLQRKKDTAHSKRQRCKGDLVLTVARIRRKRGKRRFTVVPGIRDSNKTMPSNVVRWNGWTRDHPSGCGLWARKRCLASMHRNGRDRSDVDVDDRGGHGRSHTCWRSAYCTVRVQRFRLSRKGCLLYFRPVPLTGALSDAEPGYLSYQPALPLVKRTSRINAK